VANAGSGRRRRTGHQPDDVEAAALRAVGAEGADVADVAAMSRQQLAYWLTSNERRTLAPDEMLLRLIVRSARLDGA
jgi:hypothetical protein